MIVTISSRHMDVTAAMKTFAEQKANKLSRYYDLIQEIEVIFDAGKGQTKVEMIVNAEHKNMFIANHDEQCAAHFIKLSVAPDGKTYTVSIPSSGHSRTFQTRTP